MSAPVWTLTLAPSYRGGCRTETFTAADLLAYLQQHARDVEPSPRKDTACVVGALFSAPQRVRANVTALSAVAFDVEAERYDQHPEHVFRRIGADAFTWSTQSHGVRPKWAPEHPRFRGLIRLARPVEGDPDTVTQAHAALQRWASQWFAGVDARGPEQAQLLPTRPVREAEAAPWVRYIAGAPLDPDALPLPDGTTVRLDELVQLERARGVASGAERLDDEQLRARVAAWGAATDVERGTAAHTAHAALQRACEALAEAEQGERTSAMFGAGCTLGSWSATGLLADADVSRWRGRILEAASLAFGDEHDEGDAARQVDNAIARGRRTPPDVARWRAPDVGTLQRAPMLTLAEAERVTREAIHRAVVGAGLHVVAASPAVGKSRAVVAEAATFVQHGAGRPSMVLTAPTHAKCRELRADVLDAIEALDLHDEREREALRKRVILDVGRSSEPGAEHYCAEHATYDALYRVDPGAAEGYCKACPRRDTCPFVTITGGRHHTPDTLVGRVVIRTHARHHAAAARLAPEGEAGCRLNDREILQRWGYCAGGDGYDDTCRWRPRVKLTAHGARRLTVERAPVAGYPAPELLEHTHYDLTDDGPRVTEAGRVELLTWFAELGVGDTAPELGEIVGRWCAEPWAHSAVVVDESAWGAVASSWRITRTQLAGAIAVGAIEETLDSRKLLALLDGAAEGRRGVTCEAVAAHLAGSVVDVDRGAVDELRERVTRDALSRRSAGPDVVSHLLAQLPDDGACEALAKASRDGWHNVEVAPDGTLTIHAAPDAWRVDVARTTLYLDATASEIDTRATFGRAPDTVTSARAPLAEGCHVERVERVATHHRDLVDRSREDRPNVAPFVRWAGLHALRRGGRTLHVITKGARDVVDCAAVVEQLEALGDAVIHHNGTEARGANAYQSHDCVILDGWKVPQSAIAARARVLHVATGCAIADCEAEARFQLEDAPTVQAAHRVRGIRHTRRVVYVGDRDLADLPPDRVTTRKELDRELHDATGWIPARGAADLGASLLRDALDRGAVVVAGRDVVSRASLAPWVGVTDPRPDCPILVMALRARACHPPDVDPVSAVLRRHERDAEQLAAAVGGDATPVRLGDGSERWFLHAPGVVLQRDAIVEALTLARVAVPTWAEVDGRRMHLTASQLEQALWKVTTAEGEPPTARVIAEAAGVDVRTVRRWIADAGGAEAVAVLWGCILDERSARRRRRARDRVRYPMRAPRPVVELAPRALHGVCIVATWSTAPRGRPREALSAEALAG